MGASLLAVAKSIYYTGRFATTTFTNRQLCMDHNKNKIRMYFIPSNFLLLTLHHLSYLLIQDIPVS